MSEKQIPSIVTAILTNCVLVDYGHLSNFLDFVLYYLEHSPYQEPINYEIGKKLVSVGRDVFNQICKDYPDETVAVRATKVLERKIQLAEKVNEYMWVSHCAEHWRGNLDEGEPAYEQYKFHSDKASELAKELKEIKKELGFNFKKKRTKNNEIGKETVIVAPPFSLN